MSVHPMGIYERMPREDYDAVTNAISNSRVLKHLREASPAKAWQMWQKPPEKKETTALRFGRLFHQCILEPNEWISSVEIKPTIDREEFGAPNAKKHIAEKARIERDRQARGVEWIDPEEKKVFDRMAEAVNAHPEAGRLLRNGKPEVSCFAVVSGIYAKCRTDLWLDRDGWLWDLKTADDASPEGFSRAVFNHRYHIQAAFYTRLFRAAWAADEQLRGSAPSVQGFGFVVVEKGDDEWLQMPLEYLVKAKVTTYRLARRAMSLGDVEVDCLLDEWGACVAGGEFLGLASGDIDVPVWASGDIERRYGE